jgi:hypothetical protein
MIEILPDTISFNTSKEYEEHWKVVVAYWNAMTPVTVDVYTCWSRECETLDMDDFHRLRYYVTNVQLEEVPHKNRRIRFELHVVKYGPVRRPRRGLKSDDEDKDEHPGDVMTFYSAPFPMHNHALNSMVCAEGGTVPFFKLEEFLVKVQPLALQRKQHELEEHILAQQLHSATATTR